MHYPKLLSLEPLEVRRVLAAVTVTNNTDEVNGDVSSVAALIADPGEDGVSLREAIEATNATPGADEIDFDFGHDGPETIVLGGTELHISDDLTINGPGAELLAIDGNGESRVFYIDDTNGSTGSKIIIQAISVMNGDAYPTFNEPNPYGGGIANYEALMLVDVELGNGRGLYGGGLANYSTATLVDVTVSNNFAGQLGGGVYNEGDLALNRVILSGNESLDFGGGLFNQGVASVSNSLVTGNSSWFGNGIENYDAGMMAIVSTTVSANLSRNHDPSQSDGVENRAILRLVNSMVANHGEGKDVRTTGEGASVFAEGTNIISDSSLTGPNILNVDPMLDENGVPLPGSPAIDAGDTSLAVDADGNPLKWDVRGEGYRRVLGYGVDIGAFEAPGFLPGDSTDDGVVDLVDFNILKDSFGESVESYLDGDYNGDGVVDLIDFNILKANFGEQLIVAGDLVAAVAINAALSDADEE